MKEYIIQRVCDRFDITQNLLISKYRQRFIIDARQTVVFALTKLGFTQQDVAERLNYADHTTVNHLLNKRIHNSLKNRTLANQIIKEYDDMTDEEKSRYNENMGEK